MPTGFSRVSEIQGVFVHPMAVLTELRVRNPRTRQERFDQEGVVNTAGSHMKVAEHGLSPLIYFGVYYPLSSLFS